MSAGPHCRYPVLTSNRARCSVLPCLNLRSDCCERTRQATSDMVSVGGPPSRGGERPVVSPSHHRRPDHARARLPEEGLRRAEALARKRAAHLHPAGSVAVQGGRGRRRGDRGARGGGAAFALEPAARGARTGRYARRGRVLAATGGLAEQDGRVLKEEVVRSFALTVVAAEAAARRLPLKRQCVPVYGQVPSREFTRALARVPDR